MLWDVLNEHHVLLNLVKEDVFWLFVAPHRRFAPKPENLDVDDDWCDNNEAKRPPDFSLIMLYVKYSDLDQVIASISLRQPILLRHIQLHSRIVK